MTPRALVLVIDDEADMREMLALVLHARGLEVETADSGQAALAAVARRRFEVAITDLRMPGMDGIATLDALKARDPALEVIVATGYASDETAAICMQRGAYGYLRKPFGIDDLQAIIERALTARGAHA
jgi:DNA-binding NtrC family response regulator